MVFPMAWAFFDVTGVTKAPMPVIGFSVSVR
jgi:hypothetical protein